MASRYTRTHIRTHTGISSGLRKEEILPFLTTRMALENVALSERSQTQKDRYRMVALTCGIQNSQLSSQELAVVARGPGRGEWRDIRRRV